MAEAHPPEASDEHPTDAGHAAGVGHAGDAGHPAEAGHDGHGEAPLGPIDVQSWGAAVGGVFLGLLVVLALIQALS